MLRQHFSAFSHFFSRLFRFLLFSASPVAAINSSSPAARLTAIRIRQSAGHRKNLPASAGHEAVTAGITR
ncbi:MULTISPECIES: hypothetical protein [unclassified Tatumella]|uniref:hypothetical protein n=1 Tax=unclassified Tatumella TaxID=2649542 RepID=UPI001BAFC4E8|nr:MULTISPECIES: hypothetical protein [unclassified Tatumella]MBS0877756.1 hypothetical protein [Tatumella sp. JGM82]MBS0891455.1 hypothetical protein [Tatumella sp. JGM94]MBS0902391.1 hypothetical protein [Tatumella sp. JGM100]